MTNPITGKMGVETALSFADELAPAVYVLDGTLTAVPSEVERLEYRGTVVVLVLSNNNIEVYGCDEVGKVMTGLQRTIKL